MSTPAEIKTFAEENYAWLIAYQEAGFTEEQAMAMLTRPVVSINQTGMTPELSEFIAKATRIFETVLEDDQ